MLKDPASQQLEELKTFLFTYVVIAPLLSAIFADKIDNIFIACVLFIAMVGSSFLFIRKRLVLLGESIREQEAKLMECAARVDLNNDEKEQI